MFENILDLYNELIREHDKNPRNFHKLENATQSARGYNPICGDDVTVYLILKDGVIKDASFLGKSCAICKASASMLTESVKGKTQTQAEEIFEKVRNLMMTGNAEGEMGKLSAFSTIHKRPVKLKCAILPWHALMGALKGEAAPVTTESENN